MTVKARGLRYFQYFLPVGGAQSPNFALKYQTWSSIWLRDAVSGEWNAAERERERERERGDNRSGIKGKAETASDGPVSEMG